MIPKHYWLLILLGLWGTAEVASAQDRFAAARTQLVRSALENSGITDERVLQAMRTTPRHEFVPHNQRDNAYVDTALPIGEGQTISPPFVVAFMTQELDPQPDDRVLEIGTGSGYQAAVLSGLVKDVYTIEIVPRLGRTAEQALRKAGYRNVHVRVGDGFKGWPEAAPFDKIIVTCSPENVPEPLVEQLKEGGRMVIPLGQRFQQTLYLFRKEDGQLVQEALRPTLFVPMTGEAERRREVQPDGRNPEIVNGSFEEMAVRKEGEEPMLVGWHYLRHGEVVEDRLAPDGNHFLRFRNDVPGRLARTVQGFALDGRQVSRLAVSTWIRVNSVQAGRRPDQLAYVHVTYYDDDRRTVGEDWLGPWFGTFDWEQKAGVLDVPRTTRSAIVMIGLLGGVGEADFDHVRLRAAR